MAKSTRKTLRLAKPKSAKARSLTEFVRDQKRAGCAVCQLPPALYAEVRTARAKHITRAVVIEWLKAEHGITISPDAFDSHTSGRHDYGAADAA